MTAFERVVVQALREAASYTRIQLRKEAYLQAAKSIESGRMKIELGPNAPTEDRGGDPSHS